MFTLCALFTGSALVLILLSVPLLLRKVKPNPWYGFRTPATLNDPELWYAVNEFTARRLLVVGIVVVLAAVGLYFVPGLSLDAYALLMLGVFVVAFWVAILQSVRHLRRLQR